MHTNRSQKYSYKTPRVLLLPSSEHSNIIYSNALKEGATGTTLKEAALNDQSPIRILGSQNSQIEK